jgi:hypothetical protein
MCLPWIACVETPGVSHPNNSLEAVSVERVRARQVALENVVAIDLFDELFTCRFIFIYLFIFFVLGCDSCFHPQINLP